MDDSILVSNNLDFLKTIKIEFSQAFEVTNNGELHYCLGIQVLKNCNKHLIHINQNKYVLDKLALYGMVHCNPISTPMTFSTKLTQAMSPQTPQKKLLPCPQFLMLLLWVASFMPLLQLNLILHL